MKENKLEKFENLNQCQKALKEHKWAILTTSFQEYGLAMRAEHELFRRCQSSGLHFFNEFRQAHERAYQKHLDKATAAVTKECNRRIEEVRNRYMRPEDKFEERCQNHNWDLAFDQSNKFGNVKHEMLMKDAAKNPTFQAIFDRYLAQAEAPAAVAA